MMTFKPKYFLYAIHFTVLFSAWWSFAASADTTFQWPKKIKAAVSLSYDDALDSQLDVAIPALNKYRLKGSFYLQLSSPTIYKRLSEWRTAAAKGHELGNHSLFHQCSRSTPGHEWVKPENDLDQMSVVQIRNQILLANTMLYAIDGKHERTFTAPCTDIMVGGENYLTGLKNEFVAIKAVAGSGITPDMKSLDPYLVNVKIPSNVTGAELIAMVNEAGEKGTMVNFTFHGINGEYISTSKAAHDELLAFLAQHRDIYWTDTFLHIMQYVKKQQAQQK